MKVSEDQLIVYYKQDIDRKLDDAIELVLEKFGYCREGSGMQMAGEDAGVRDLSFIKRVICT